MGAGDTPRRKLKLLGLHGFRTSGNILDRQLGKWDPSLHELIDVDVIDGPLPCMGKSDVEGYFDGPYYEWFRANKDFTKFELVDETISYITDYLKLHGPYDGLIGFSQGAVLAGCLAGLQEKGMALQDVPPIRFLVLIAPAQLRAPHLKVIYQEPTIKCPAAVLLGEKDWLKPAGEELMKSFQHTTVINHRYGHTVPRLDEDATAVLCTFLTSKLMDTSEGDTSEDMSLLSNGIASGTANASQEDGYLASYVIELEHDNKGQRDSSEVETLSSNCKPKDQMDEVIVTA